MKFKEIYFTFYSGGLKTEMEEPTRQVYKGEKGNEGKKSSSAAKKRIIWRYYFKIIFMEPSVRERETMSNMPAETVLNPPPPRILHHIPG